MREAIVATLVSLFLFFFSLVFFTNLSNFMQYIGIDMSKDTFHAAFDDEKVRIFSNTPGGIGVFLAALSEKGAKRKETTLGVEATGPYHLLLAEVLRRDGWQIKVINPFVTSRMFKGTMRRLKTDTADAKAIRTCLMAGQGYCYTDTPEILALKALVQERETLCKHRAVFKRCQHTHSYKARAVPMPLHDSFSATIAMISKEISILEQKMAICAKPTQTLLKTVTGVGKTSAAALVAYVGDIARFPSPEKLTAYIGLDCRVHESGTSIHGKGYITKRGNKYLRSLLFNAAFIARRHDPELKAYFEKKISEGKHYFSAMCAVERKLIHRIYAVWKRGTPFEIRQEMKRPGEVVPRPGA